jgi:NTE family protein
MTDAPAPAVASRPADLVLEGGGVKGIGLAGAVGALADAGYRFQRVSGTSAGAIAACLVTALQATGRPMSDLHDILTSVDFARFTEKHGLRKVLGPIGDAEHLLFHMGIFDGDYLVDWLGGVLADLGGPTHFGDLRTADPGADSNLNPDQCYSLVVTTSDISRGKCVRLPWDYRQYGLDPDRRRLVDAVRASMSIPFFFEPVRFDAPAVEPFPAGTVTWVDGGMLDNFPVDVFDRTDGKPSRWSTIGIKLSAKQVVAQPAATGSAVSEAIACLHTVLDNADRFYVTPERAARTIFVDNCGVKSTQFDLTAADQRALFDSGTQAATEWLTKTP